VSKTLKTRGHFPTDEAALKLIYLAIQRVQEKWRNPSPWWPAARLALETLYGERVPLP
jgi:transposase-like protein